MINFDNLVEAKHPDKPKKEDSLKLKNYECIIFTSPDEPREKAIVLDCEYNGRLVFEISYNKSKRDKYIELIKNNYTKINFKEQSYEQIKQSESGETDKREGSNDSIIERGGESNDNIRTITEDDNRPDVDIQGSESEGVWCSIY